VVLYLHATLFSCKKNVYRYKIITLSSKNDTMPNKAKVKVEEFKKEAKQYYKWKNMISRYIIIWFLVLLIALQFFLPRQNHENNNSIVQNMAQKSHNDIQEVFSFFDQDFDLWSGDYYFQSHLDHAIADIVSNPNKLANIYKKSLIYLPDFQDKLKKAWLHTDFQYLMFLNEFENPVFDINMEAVNHYWLVQDKYIDESLDLQKSSNLSVFYLQDLYNTFEDNHLVLLWYLMWGEELQKTMMSQNQKIRANLYLPKDIESRYFETIAYKYIVSNISDYIDMQDFQSYKPLATDTIKLWETKDLIKRANKQWYTFKEIKELNPWILWDSLPKGKREIQVYKR